MTPAAPERVLLRALEESGHRVEVHEREGLYVIASCEACSWRRPYGEVDLAGMGSLDALLGVVGREHNLLVRQAAARRAAALDPGFY